MNNTTTTANNTLSTLLNDVDFKRGTKFVSIANLTKQFNNLGTKQFDVSINLALEVSESFSYYKSSVCKEILKLHELKMNADMFAKEVLNMSKSYMYLLAQCGAIHIDTINEYKAQSKDTLSLKNLVKFANPSDVSDNIESEETESEETESEEKQPKVENLKISVSKDNKISIKGKASKEVITLLIEELKKMMA